MTTPTGLSLSERFQALEAAVADLQQCTRDGRCPIHNLAATMPHDNPEGAELARLRLENDALREALANEMVAHAETYERALAAELRGTLNEQD